MTKGFAVRLTLAAAAMSFPSIALAQSGWTPGAEVLGQPIQVTTNGVTNTLYLDAGGGLRILTPNGSLVQGTWAVNGTQLCLSVAGQQECVPYDSPLLAGQPKTVTSSCNVVQTWVAQANNTPQPQAKSERGQ